MLKTALYGGLAVIGVFAALFSPLYGAIAVLEAYLLHPTLYSPELSSIRFQLLITAAFIAGYLLHIPRGLPRVGSESISLWLLCVYALVVLASSQWAERRPDVALPFAIDLGKTVLVTVFLVNVPSSPGDITRILWAVVIGCTHAAFMHTLGVNLGYLPESLGRGEMGAVPDFQGSIMIFILPTVLLLALGAQSWLGRLFCAGSAVLVADSIVNTYQRTFFVAMAAQLVYLLLICPRRLLLRLMLVIAMGGVAAASLFMPPDYFDWIRTIRTYEEEASASSRLKIAEASLQILADNPLGVGYRNYQYVSPDYLPDYLMTTNESGERVRAAHNSYAAVACETGVAGIFFFCAAFGGTWWLLRKTRRISSQLPPDDLTLFTSGLEAGMIGWAVAGLFQSLHEDDPVFWTVAISIMLFRARCQLVTPPVSDVETPASVEALRLAVRL